MNKKLMISFILIGALVGGAIAYKMWSTPVLPSVLAQALEKAASTNKQVLVVLSADWCLPCKKLKTEVLQAPEMAAVMERFILVIIQADGLEKWNYKDLDTTNLPSIFILNADGTETKRITGYNDKESFKKLFFSDDLEADLKKKMEEDSLNPEWATQLYTYYISRDRDADAKNLMMKYSILSSHFAKETYHLLRFMEITGSYNKSRPDYKKVAELGEQFIKDFPGDDYIPSTEYFRASALRLDGEPAKAIEVIRSLPMRYPKSSSSYWQLLRFSRDSKTLNKEAEDIIAKGEVEFKDNFYFLLQAAQWLYANGRDDDAQRFLDKALVLEPENAFMLDLKREWAASN